MITMLGSVLFFLCLYGIHKIAKQKREISYLNNKLARYDIPPEFVYRPSDSDIDIEDEIERITNACGEQSSFIITPNCMYKKDLHS
jgi:hypothetical protein